MHNTPGLYAVKAMGGTFVHDETESAQVIHVFGDVDLASAVEFEETLTNASQAGMPVVVDLSECRFIDSSVIAVLIRAHKRLGKGLRLVVPHTGNVARVLGICKLDAVFGISRSLEQAIGGPVAA